MRDPLRDFYAEFEVGRHFLLPSFEHARLGHTVEGVVDLNSRQTLGVVRQHLFGWQGQGNRYANFMQLLDQQPPNEGMRPAPYSQEKWKAFSGDTSDGQFPRGKLVDLPMANYPMALTLPSHFKSEQTAGATIEQLPKPASDAR